MTSIGRPLVGNGSYVDPKASVLGNVRIGKGVYVAPFASLRADEPGSSIVISDGANVQDGVVVHALRGSSVFVGEGSTLGHACIVHGPCEIGSGCMIGFGALVFRSAIGGGSAVLHRAIVNNARVPEGRMVAMGALVGSDADASDLPPVCADTLTLMDSARSVNAMLASAYSSDSSVR
jgi:carbonic anhydrase/acetyltransferase-like protein (isoleucine patch superfamily)